MILRDVVSEFKSRAAFPTLCLATGLYKNKCNQIISFISYSNATLSITLSELQIGFLMYIHPIDNGDIFLFFILKS